MRAQPDIAIAGVGLMVLVGLGLLVALFYNQKTRPLGWMLLGVLVAAFFGMVIVRTQLQPHAVEVFHSAETPIDVDRLVGPRISFDGHRSTIIGDSSAHPSQPPQPLETHETHATAPSAAAAAQPDEGNEPDSQESVEHATSDGPSPSASELNGPRPAWLNANASRSNAFQFVVETGACSTREQADDESNKAMIIKTTDVLGSLVGRDLTAEPYHRVGEDSYDTIPEWKYRYSRSWLLRLGLTLADIRENAWKDEYVEQSNLDLETGPFPMVKVYTLLEYTPEFRDDLQLRWRQYQSRERLFEVGIVAACILGGLSLVWGVLKFDSVTKGYYTKWLIIGGSLVTMVVVGFLIIATS